jgi:hypothetical protein
MRNRACCETPGRAYPLGPKVVAADKFVLRDAKGQVRASLSVGERGVGLYRYGADRKGAAALAITPEGAPALNLTGADGGAILGVPAGGGPELELTDGEGRVLHHVPARAKLGRAGDGPAGDGGGGGASSLRDGIEADTSPSSLGRVLAADPGER